MLKYFIDIDITDQTAVKKKYRELAKMYHPDIPGNRDKNPNCEEIIKVINNEMDLITSGRINNSPLSTYEAPKKESVNKYVIRAIYVIWDNRNKRYVAPCYGDILDLSNWKHKHGCGLFVVEILKHRSFPFIDIITRVFENATFDIPEFSEIADFYIDKIRDSFAFESWDDKLDHEYHYVQTNRGEFLYRLRYIERYNPVPYPIKNREIELLTKICIPGKQPYLETLDIQLSNLGKVEYEETVSLRDIVYQSMWGYTYDEFNERYSVAAHEIFSKFYMKMRLTKDHTLPHDADPLIYYWISIGAIKIFECPEHRNIRYGILDIKKLGMRKVSIEDLDIAQDYLDQLNDECVNTVRRMIKKGTIKLVI